MKTLSTNVNNGRAGGSEPIYLIRLIPKSGDAWSELRWATKSVTITGWGAFTGGRIAPGGLPILEQSFDWFKGGGVAQMGNFTVKLLNQDKYQDTLGIGEETNYYENRLMNIYIVFANGSLSTSDCSLLQSGVVRQISYSIEEIVFECVDAKQFDLKDVAVETIEEGVDSPQGNDGTVIPLVYGQLYRGGEYYNNVNRLPLIKTNKAKDKYVVSQNECKSLEYVLFTKFSIYDPDTNCHVMTRWGNTSTQQETITYGRPTTLEFTRDYTLLGAVVKQMDSMGSQTIPSSLDGSDAIDDSETSYVTVGNSQKLYFKVRIPVDLFEMIEDTQISIIVKFGTVTGTGNGKIRYYNADWDNGTGKFSDGLVFNDLASGGQRQYDISTAGSGDNSAHGKDELQADQNDDWTPQEINTYEFGVECDANLSAQVKQIYIDISYVTMRKEAVTKLIRKIIPTGRRGIRKKIITENMLVSPAIEHTFDTVTVKAKGSKFGSWVDADSRDNGYNQNDLIENPAYIIEEILRTECGFATADIDIASFDAIGNTTDGLRKTFYFAGTVNETQNALDVITQICREAHLLFFINHEGKARLVDIQTPSGSAHTVNLFLFSDYKRARSSFKVELSSADNLYTDIFINFAKNFLSGNYDGQHYVKGEDSPDYKGLTYTTPWAILDGVKDDFKMRKVLVFDCDWIQEITATRNPGLMTYLARHYGRQRHIYRFTTSLEALDLELGDLVNISHPLLSSGLPSKNEMITSVKIDCNKDVIYLEAVEYQF